MDLFRNLRLSVRLGAVFGAVAAGLLILAVFGVHSLGSEYDTAERLGYKDMPAAKQLGSIQFAMVAYRADQLASGSRSPRRRAPRTCRTPRTPTWAPARS